MASALLCTRIDAAKLGVPSWDPPELPEELERAIRFHATRIPGYTVDSFVGLLNGLDNFDAGVCEGEILITHLNLNVYDLKYSELECDFTLRIHSSLENPIQALHVENEEDLVTEHQPLLIAPLYGHDTLMFEVFSLMDPEDEESLEYVGDTARDEPFRVVDHALNGMLRRKLFYPGVAEAVGHLELRALWHPNLHKAVHRVAEDILRERVSQPRPGQYTIADWREAAALRLPGPLRLTVVRACFNRPRCKVDEPHMYIIVRHGGQVIYRSRPQLNCEPFRWYTWQITKDIEDIAFETVLTFCVYDSDPCTEDEFLGSADVELGDVATGRKRWLVLQHPTKQRSDTAVVYIEGTWAGEASKMQRAHLVKRFIEGGQRKAAQVKELFFSMLNDQIGWLDRQEMRDVVHCWAHYARPVDETFSETGFAAENKLHGIGKVTYEEFATMVHKLPFPRS